MSNRKVFYIPIALSVAMTVFRAERPSGRGVTKIVSICRKLNRPATVCVISPRGDGQCELVYAPATEAGKLGSFYIRGHSHLECAMSIPITTYKDNL